MGWKSWAPDDMSSGGVKVGDPVKRMGGEFFWSKHHVYGKQLEELRAHGDPLVDGVVESLSLKPQDDIIELIFPSQNGGTVSKNNPGGDNKTVDRLKVHLLSTPEWVDQDKVRRAQNFFHRHGPAAGMALLNLSLAGGFSAPRINQVLASTGYMSNSSKSYLRLVETLQMINDCMQPGALEPHGRGWTSCIRVRFLHAKIRRRLAKSNYYDVKKFGVAINQEDMCATLLSFQILVIEVLEYIGYNVSPQEKEDYTHLWRLIGYWSGVCEETNPCGTYQISRATLESITMHLIDPSTDNTCAQMTKNVLLSVAYKAPFYWSFETLAQLSRMFMGHELADALDLPPESRLLRFFHNSNFAVMRTTTALSYVPIIGSSMVSLNNAFMEHWVDSMQQNKRTKFKLNYPPPISNEEKIKIDHRVLHDNEALQARIRNRGYWECYLCELRSNPLKTKMFSSAVLTGMGQVFGNFLAGRKFNKRRFLAFGLFGLLGTGPIIHYWLKVLRSYGPSNIYLQVAIDRLAFHPPFQYLFFLSVGMMEGRGFRSVIEETNKSFSSVILNALKFWPPVMFLNLKFIPAELQVLCSSTAAFFWSCYLGLASR